MVKNLPANVGDKFNQSLGHEDTLEKEMATYSSILGWEIPWTEEPGRLQSMELQRVGNNLATKQQQQSPCCLMDHSLASYSFVTHTISYWC